MVINAPCYCNEALAIPEQTATGKEISNPFMADWKPKNAKDDKVTKEFKFIKEQIKEKELKASSMISHETEEFYKKTGHFAREEHQRKSRRAEKRCRENTGFREKDNEEET
ncbi:hypothetical protein Tco_0024605 [Tanacetum coccineum]